MTGTGVDNIDFMMFMKMMVTCHPGKHCNAAEVGEEPHHHADYLWDVLSCMEYDKQGDVEEDHADDVHADDVAMEVVEHGQNGVHQERDDEGSQADLGTYTLFVGLMMQKSNIALSSKDECSTGFKQFS